MSEIKEVSMAEFLAYTEPGDQDWSWRSQFRYLEDNFEDKLRELKDEIFFDGQKEPVEVGPDHRVWDGHHRIYCLVLLGYTHIKVRYV